MLTEQIFILIFFITFNFPLTSAQCNYRQYKNLPENLFKYWSSWGCYRFVNPIVFKGPPLEIELEHNIPGLYYGDEFTPFDYENEMIVQDVQNTLKWEKTVERWKECSRVARDCCLNMVESANSSAEDGSCPSIWDAWSCFPSVKSGITHQQACSKFAYVANPPRCKLYSSKKCFENGTWQEKTDYSQCDATLIYLPRTKWHISWLTISILICAPGVIILLILEGLQTQKLILIRNLLLAVITRNFILVLVKSILILDELKPLKPGEETIISANNWPCKMLSFFEKLSGNIVFVLMLLEGIYLHQLITNVFGNRQTEGPQLLWYYIGCFSVALSTALIWAIMMATNYDHFCWQVTEGTNYYWINDAPRLIMLLVNYLLLTHILYKLWKTFRHNNENDNSRALKQTVRAALICLPTFGVPYLFLIIHPNTDDCTWEQVYYFIYYLMEALQGIFIVIFHCYRDRDVKKVSRAFMNKLFIDRKNREFGRRSIPTESDPIRRVTLNTTIEIRNSLQPENSVTVKSTFSPNNSVKIQNKITSPKANNDGSYQNQPS